MNIINKLLSVNLLTLVTVKFGRTLKGINGKYYQTYKWFAELLVWIYLPYMHLIVFLFFMYRINDSLWDIFLLIVGVIVIEYIVLIFTPMREVKDKNGEWK